MYGFDYKKDLDIGRLCLEMSLKPFKNLDDQTIDEVCNTMFSQWQSLIAKASSLAVMLWCADGSEILDYPGNMDAEFEWARHIGNPNAPEDTPWDPEKKGLHAKSVLYMENPPVFHYSDLKKIISKLKEIGKNRYGLPVEVGATFDPGPEFAVSDFKFNRHTEIVKGDTVCKNQWIHCAVTLHADSRAYAAYPDGIPEGTHFGEFIGRQYSALAKDVGFDYLWLSNGFGYSRDSWSFKGECFDGKSFDEENSAKIKESILEFWEKLTENCKTRIETRGSNLSTGMDISAHGSPVEEIYKYNIVAPPNSPWAAMDSRFGLELCGYMSHIASLPEAGYLFRYYTHDPWWLNSPWFDRYDRIPHDIYLPLAVARLDQNGGVTKPMGINFLTVDDSLGNLPERCPAEVIPHILNAYQTYPDEAGCVTWLYPFQAYHKLGFSGRKSEVFFGDWFMNNAIEYGFPLSTVISDENISGLKQESWRKTIVVAPVPDKGSAAEKKVLAILEDGGRVLLYGPADCAGDEMLSLMGVRLADGIEGDLEISGVIPDSTQKGTFSNHLIHKSLFSGGKINTIALNSEAVFARVQKDGEIRDYCTCNERALKGRLAYVRGSFSYDDTDERLPEPHTFDKHFVSGILMRSALEKLGLKLSFDCYSPDAKRPVILISRHRNALQFTEYSKEATGSITLCLEDGAPVLNSRECIVSEKGAVYLMSKFNRSECRVFVKQKKESIVACEVQPSVLPGVDKRIGVTGLVNADVIFYPEPETSYRIVHNRMDQFADTNIAYEVLPGGEKVLVKAVTGSLMFAWGSI